MCTRIGGPSITLHDKTLMERARSVLDWEGLHTCGICVGFVHMHAMGMCMCVCVCLNVWSMPVCVCMNVCVGMHVCRCVHMPVEMCTCICEMCVVGSVYVCVCFLELYRMGSLR